MVLTALLLVMPMPTVVVDRTVLGTSGPQVAGATWYRVGWGETTPIRVSGTAKTDEVQHATMYDGSFPDDGVLLSRRPRFPRRVTRIGTAPSAYQAFSRDLFVAMGHSPKTIKLGPLVRADLDGDGREEAIWSASADDTGPGQEQKRAASGIFVRRLGPKGVRTYTLHKSAATGYNLERGRVRTVADLDGDGRMEVVITVDGYEWWYSQAWGVGTGGPKKLLEGGGGV